MRKLTGRKIGAKTSMQLQRKANVDYQSLSIDELKVKLDIAYDFYKKLKAKAGQLRESFLESLVHALEAEGKGKQATIIEGLIKTEHQQQTFRKLKPISRKFSEKLSTTSVIINNNGVTEELTRKEQMEKAIILENKKKFHQCEATRPFLAEPLRSQFGKFGKTETTEAVINGTYVPDKNSPPSLKTFFKVCHKSSPDTAMSRSPTEFKNSWKAMKEKTASHDLHFGHFKAACKHDDNLFVHYILAEIPMQTGFSPKRWQVATNVMILKKAKLFNIDKLRMLCFFQADYNLNNKFLGHSIMKHAVETKQMASEQYSMTGKHSISHALNKTLLFDVLRYQKYSVGLTSCDLRSCFD